MAHQKTHPLKSRGVLRGREGDVDRRRLGLPPDLPQARDQRLAGPLRSVGRDQQASSGRGGEGDRDLQLGIVVAARPRVGVRPCVVEDILPHAVALEVGRGRGDDGARAVLDDNMRGRPARPAGGRARGFERVQEGVGHERVEPLAFGRSLRKAGRIGARVPRRRIDGRDGWNEARSEGGHGGKGGGLGSPPS